MMQGPLVPAPHVVQASSPAYSPMVVVVAVTVVAAVLPSPPPQPPHMAAHCAAIAGTAHALIPMVAQLASAFTLPAQSSLSAGHVPHVCGHPSCTLGRILHHMASSPAHDDSSAQTCPSSAEVELVVVTVVTVLTELLAGASPPSHGTSHKVGHPSLTAAMNVHMLLSNAAQSTGSSPRPLHPSVPTSVPWSSPTNTHFPHSFGQFS